MERSRFSSTTATTLASIVLLSLFAPKVSGASAGLDPILNYCSRWQHASVVKNEILYVDGGVQTFRVNNLTYSNSNTTTDNFLGVNEWTVVTWMNQTWDWRSNVTQQKLSKDRDPQAVVDTLNGTIRGAFWKGPADDRKIYTFGGTSFMGNKSFEGWKQTESPTNPLWSFDPQSRTWNAYSSSLIESPNNGASAEAPDQGFGFYLNGQIDEGSKFHAGPTGNETRNLDGMVIVDLSNHTMVNVSTPGLDEATYPRVGGLLAYVPNVGKRGILVSMGGAYRDSAGIGQYRTQTLATFDEVSVFDLASYFDNLNSNGTWYRQKTTGDIPAPRVDSCIVVASAPDNSSHNIYLYGGRDPFTNNGTTMYDDVKVLSLPSFTWKHLYVGTSPRWGHSCHLVGQRQMLTVGGSINATEWGGPHSCDWEYRGVAILDLSINKWGPFYIHDAQPYEVTADLLPVIGGNATGGATLATPTAGWTNPSLAAVMSATRTPIIKSVSTSHSSGTSRATIIGASIGSTVGAAILGAILFMYLRIRRTQSKRTKTFLVESGAIEKNELVGDQRHPVEVPDNKELPFEMGAEHGTSEASPISSTNGRAELLAGDPFHSIAELSGDCVEKPPVWLESPLNHVRDIVVPEESENTSSNSFYTEGDDNREETPRADDEEHETPPPDFEKPQQLEDNLYTKKSDGST